MLRRSPTAITLTSDDVAAYEDSRLARLAANSSLNQRGTSGASAGRAGTPLENTSGASSRKGTPADPSDELKPLPGDKVRAVRYAAADASRADGRSREERIGVAR